MVQDVRNILLVEDNPNDIELTLSALEAHNLANEVIVTRDGAEALDYLYRLGPFKMRKPGNPTLMLLDLKMPKVDGIEVLRQVKADPELRAIPVVILTSSAEECDVVETYNLNVNAYVVKPVDFHDFVEAVKRIGLFWGIINVVPTNNH